MFRTRLSVSGRVCESFSDGNVTYWRDDDPVGVIPKVYFASGAAMFLCWMEQTHLSVAWWIPVTGLTSLVERHWSKQGVKVF